MQFEKLQIIVDIRRYFLPHSETSNHISDEMLM